MSDIEASILLELDNIEKQHDVKIIHAIESGSRAWGFPSPDSDYDVRFIYMHPKDWYVSVFEKRDVIELPVDEVLDINGWDIKKVFQLMTKANGPLYEWLQSPIVYRQMQAQYSMLLKTALKNYNALGVFHHYKSMTKSKTLELQQSDDQVKLKTYLYALRTALCCEWIIENDTQPSVVFHELLHSFFVRENNESLKSAIAEILLKKQGATEKTLIPRSKPIDQYLINALKRFENSLLIQSVKVDTHEIDKELLNILNV